MQNMATLPVWRRKTLLITLLALFIACLLIPASASAQQKYLYDDLFSVTFPDGNNGWACGRWGSIFHTSDGGKTWDKQESGVDYTLGAICFADEKHGWAVGDEGVIIHSSDGGKTWKRQECPVPYFLMGITFLSPTKGWIVTEQTHILYTEDGGKTWEVQFSDQDFILKAVSFADDLHGWTVGEYGYIYYTSDGGKNWQNQAGFFDISDLDGSIIAGTFLFDVAAVDPQTAWAAGIDSYVTVTTDGGTSWTEIKTGIPKTHLFSIAAPNPDTILIGGNGAFISSTDGGKTWSSPKFKPHIIYTWLYDITTIAPSKYITVGREGIIYIGDENSWVKMNY